MGAIADYFLRAKHWQIFVLFGILFAAVFVSIVCASLNPNSFGGAFAGFVVTNALFYGVFFLWLWSIGSFLYSLVRPDLRSSKGLFRFALICPLIYMLVFIRFVTSPLPIGILLPLHFLAMSCIFYGLYFVSKGLVIAETGKSASFYDCAGPFFLIWFFPLGVWFIQPRINHLYASRVELLPAS